MIIVSTSFILGSRSPRRLELLGQLVPAESIRVMPPRSTDEAGFGNLHMWPEIETRMMDVARTKCEDVLEQIHADEDGPSAKEEVVVIAADTTIVATDATGRPVVLGQPPEDGAWTETVRRWFQEFYFGRTHVAATALCVATPLGKKTERIVKSQVTFHDDGQRWLDWYLGTGEPRGKAGGYALQGAGSIFVSRVEGSISNVVGLPLEELLDVFEELEVHVD